MKSQGQNKRSEERVNATLPVSLGDVSGTTCDVSASGMYFETSAAFEPGDEIDFSVEFDAPNGKRTLKCKGTIVRTEVRGDRLGVGVRIVDSTMEMADRGVASREMRAAS